MSLKLYKINTTLNHPDCMAGLKKMMDDEIFSFFRLDIGNEEKIKRRRLELLRTLVIHWKILRKQIIFFVHLHCCFLSDLLKKLEIY